MKCQKVTPSAAVAQHLDLASNGATQMKVKNASANGTTFNSSHQTGAIQLLIFFLQQKPLLVCIYHFGADKDDHSNIQ